MENIVAVAVRLESGEERFFITWGRVQAAADDEPVASLVLRHASSYDLGGAPVSARLCATLQEASAERYFYEALFDFSNERIPSGRRYGRWRRRITAEMEDGKHLWYLGR